MTDWKTVQLGEVCTLQRGMDLPKRLRKDGEFPLVTSSGIDGTHSVGPAKGPGVITGRYGTIGKVFFVESDFWPLNTTLYVRDFHENDARFVHYLLHTVDFQSHSGKSGVPGVNRNDVHQEFVRIPVDRIEQERIAQSLLDADALIDSLEHLVTKKRQIKQGAMQELLTGKRRLPGFTANWATKRIGDLLAIRHGRSQKTVECVGGDFPILATGGQIGWASAYLHVGPSVLIGRKGTIDQPRYMDSPFWSVDTLFYSDVFHPNVAKFLYYRFCLIDWMRHNEASGVPSLGAKVIESIEIACPDATEQEAIAKALTDIDADVAALESRLTKARALKQAMAQALLTGRIRLVEPTP
jgi:type I restriction enzyme S subunit